VRSLVELDYFRLHDGVRPPTRVQAPWLIGHWLPLPLDEALRVRAPCCSPTTRVSGLTEPGTKWSKDELKIARLRRLELRGLEPLPPQCQTVP
jgi:hypothetical protein